MNAPIHKVKRYVTYDDGREPHWVEDTVQGWLASGVKDKNGREIYEGDLVKGSYFGSYWFSSAEVMYEEDSGSFIIIGEDDYYLNRPQGEKVEVVGHIAEEQS